MCLGRLLDSLQQEGSDPICPELGKGDDMAVALKNRQPTPAVELMAIIAHDLRQPLTVLRASTVLLQRRAQRADTLPTAWLDGGLAQIEEAGRRMEQLVDEIVDLAQSQAGTALPLSRRPTDLAELAAQAAAAQGTSGDRRVRLEIGQPRVHGNWDAARLRRVLENLLSNAIKYSPPGGEVVLHVKRDVCHDGDWAIVVVRDEGRGIPAADQPYIFEPFWRGANGCQVAGSGLGLASVKRIVEAHGGSITVQSQEGEGTTITVRLPCG
jgi:signal transduction histidine kinase